MEVFAVGMKEVMMIVYNFWLLDTSKLLYQPEIGTTNIKARNQASKRVKSITQRSKDAKKLKNRQKKLNLTRKYNIGRFCI
jgi:hypothetical protein